MHQPSAGIGGTAADIAIQAEQMLHIKSDDGRADRLPHRPDRSSRSSADSDRDRWFTAQRGQEYGFVDHVITRARQAARPSGPATYWSTARSWT